MSLLRSLSQISFNEEKEVIVENEVGWNKRGSKQGKVYFEACTVYFHGGVSPGLIHKRFVSAIDEANPDCRMVSQKIFDFKELGQQEFKSSALLMEELRKLGFAVTGDLKVPADLVKDGIAKTAFRAELQGKGPGPTITIMLEYDALKNGHSCGHNLIATSGLMAAAGSGQRHEGDTGPHPRDRDTGRRKRFPRWRKGGAP